jgi:hypothetical protein
VSPDVVIAHPETDQLTQQRIERRCLALLVARRRPIEAQL